MKESRGRGAFTLIELLVVIAIIAILAAILFPVFVKVRERTQVTVCASNVRQLSLAMGMYMDDYKGRFPFAGANGRYPHTRALGGSPTCYQALDPYVKDKRVRWCPAWKGNFLKWRADCGWSYWHYCGHANPWVQGYSGGKAALCGFSMSDVSSPSRKPMIAEVERVHDKHDSNYLYTVAYCDGHVRQLLLSGGRSEVKYLYVTRDGEWGYWKIPGDCD